MARGRQQLSLYSYSVHIFIWSLVVARAYVLSDVTIGSQTYFMRLYAPFFTWFSVTLQVAIGSLYFRRSPLRPLCLYMEVTLWQPHCKDTIPKIRNKCSHKRNCAASVPISTIMCLWAIYIFPWSACLFCSRKICGPILGIYKSLTDTWMWKLGLRRANPFLGIHK